MTCNRNHFASYKMSWFPPKCFDANWPYPKKVQTNLVIFSAFHNVQMHRTFATTHSPRAPDWGPLRIFTGNVGQLRLEQGFRQNFCKVCVSRIAAWLLERSLLSFLFAWYNLHGLGHGSCPFVILRHSYWLFLWEKVSSGCRPNQRKNQP